MRLNTAFGFLMLDEEDGMRREQDCPAELRSKHSRRTERGGRARELEVMLVEDRGESGGVSDG